MSSASEESVAEAVLFSGPSLGKLCRSLLASMVPAENGRPYRISRAAADDLVPAATLFVERSMRNALFARDHRQRRAVVVSGADVTATHVITGHLSEEVRDEYGIGAPPKRRAAPRTKSVGVQASLTRDKSVQTDKIPSANRGGGGSGSGGRGGGGGSGGRGGGSSGGSSGGGSSGGSSGGGSSGGGGGAAGFNFTAVPKRETAAQRRARLEAALDAEMGSDSDSDDDGPVDYSREIRIQAAFRQFLRDRGYLTAADMKLQNAQMCPGNTIFDLIVYGAVHTKAGAYGLQEVKRRGYPYQLVQQFVGLSDENRAFFSKRDRARMMQQLRGELKEWPGLPPPRKSGSQQRRARLSSDSDPEDEDARMKAAFRQFLYGGGYLTARDMKLEHEKMCPGNAIFDVIVRGDAYASDAATRLREVKRRGYPRLLVEQFVNLNEETRAYFSKGDRMETMAELRDEYQPWPAPRSARKIARRPGRGQSR